MPAELALGLPTLYGFLLVLARVSGVFAFVPLPGVQNSPPQARVALSLLITLALFPCWPQPPAAATGAGAILLRVLPEVAVGVVVGLAVAFIQEVFCIAAQVLSLNAGFSFASTIDPSTQAESGVLQVFARLASGLVFCSLGLDREVIRALSYSLQVRPAGAWITASAAETLLRVGGDMLSLALRLALPSVALLLLADLALALLGRLNAQLQLLSLAFPIKMMAALLLAAWTTALFSKLIVAFAGETFGVLHQVLRF